MNLYIIIILRRSLFFSSRCGKQKNPSSHTAHEQKKKISFRREARPEQNLRFRSSLPKSEKKRAKTEGRKPKKKEGDVNFHPFSLSLSLCSRSLSLSDALFKDEFHARKTSHIFVAAVVCNSFTHTHRTYNKNGFFCFFRVCGVSRQQEQSCFQQSVLGQEICVFQKGLDHHARDWNHGRR